jgi:hypothetical protein
MCEWLPAYTMARMGTIISARGNTRHAASRQLDDRFPQCIVHLPSAKTFTNVLCGDAYDSMLRFTSHRVCMHTSALSFRSPYVKPVRRCALQQCILYLTMKVAFHNNLSTFCLTPRQPDYLSETTFCSQAYAHTLSSNRREQHTDPALGSSNLNRA